MTANINKFSKRNNPIFISLLLIPLFLFSLDSPTHADENEYGNSPQKSAEQPSRITCEKIEHSQTLHERQSNKYGLKASICYFRPDIKEINFIEEWEPSYALQCQIDEDSTFELKYTSYTGKQNVIYLQNPAIASLTIRGLTAYYVVSLRQRKITYNVGAGLGLHEFILRYDSQAFNSLYERRFKLGTYETKISVEYFFTKASSIEIGVRNILGREIIDLETLNSKIDAGFDDFIAELVYTLHF